MVSDNHKAEYFSDTSRMHLYAFIASCIQIDPWQLIMIKLKFVLNEKFRNLGTVIAHLA